MTEQNDVASPWTPDALRKILNHDISRKQVIVVANRAPFSYYRTTNGLAVKRPASGLVTALEPIVDACSGVWIAHPGGDADQEMVDRRGRIRAPSLKTPYFVRPVWLTEEQERGYYYGFANEGLWPLCHIAHNRPLFRLEDFKHYKSVNRMFARAVVNEAHTEDPVILIQDYHFAFLPKFIREQLPNAVIVTFWHIPWPHPEAFGICPWREELLEGLLGSSILGFQTRSYCNNFFDTVDKYLESRIDRENATIFHSGETTGIKPYPISIEWPPKVLQNQPSIVDSRSQIRNQLGLPAFVKIGVGVDRLDYTKGIQERFLAIERFLELFPRWIGKFSFIQLAAPSRAKLECYRNLKNQLETVVDHINARFSVGSIKPIVFIPHHHEPSEVYGHFRGADFCYVSSLHDGMNLVAKEFVAARDDEQGVLVLSSFTGVSRELSEAILVNPYDIDGSAQALNVALTMSWGEQKERMKSMRTTVRDNNVYKWAGSMLLDASHIMRRHRIRRRIKAVQ